MKRTLVVFASALGTLIIGCANEGPTPQEVGDQLQRGVRGEGQLSPDVDRSDDPYVKPRGGRSAGPTGGG